MRTREAQPGIPLAVIRGIPIRLHWTLFPVFGLLAYSLATNVFRDEIRPGERDVAWIYGLITAALFLLSIVLHELGHAVVAQRDKLKVGSITLFFFGGVAQVEEEPRSAGVEFRVAVGGPLVSLALVVVFWAFSRVDQFGNLLETAFWWLAGINLALLLFNLVPGYPLDGGRILRSIIWQVTGNEAKATRIAVRGGQLVSLLLVGYAIYQIAIVGSIFNGLWMLMLSAFLRNAATSAGAHVLTRSVLERVTAAQAMARDLIYVPARTRVEELFEHQRVINPKTGLCGSRRRSPGRHLTNSTRIRSPRALAVDGGDPDHDPLAAIGRDHSGHDPDECAARDGSGPLPLRGCSGRRRKRRRDPVSGSNRNPDPVGRAGLTHVTARARPGCG